MPIESVIFDGHHLVQPGEVESPQPAVVVDDFMLQ